MKTEGLSFLEAVQALVDGKCIGIKRGEWTPYIVMERDYSGWSDDSRSFKAGHEDFLATDWLLVSPIIPTEEREVTVWMGIRKSDGKVIGLYTEEPQTWDSEFDLVELTGTYRAPVKEKVRKKVSWQTTFNEKGADMVRWRGRPEEVHGKSGTLTFEYEE